MQRQCTIRAMRHSGVISVVFVLGCATGGVVAQLMVPPARAGTSATRWEHLSSRVPNGELTSNLNRSGAEGWELVSMTPGHQDHEFGGGFEIDLFVVCSKRPLP